MVFQHFFAGCILLNAHQNISDLKTQEYFLKKIFEANTDNAFPSYSLFHKFKKCSIGLVGGYCGDVEM